MLIPRAELGVSTTSGGQLGVVLSPTSEGRGINSDKGIVRR